MKSVRRVFLVINLLWTSFTVVLLGVISAMIILEPGFPLGLGWIHTRGLAGLWITIPSALLALAGLVLLQTGRNAGAWLLLIYSSLWSLMLVPAMLRELPTIVRHPIAHCANGTCTPWVITASITLAFVLSAVGYARWVYGPAVESQRA